MASHLLHSALVQSRKAWAPWEAALIKGKGLIPLPDRRDGIRGVILEGHRPMLIVRDVTAHTVQNETKRDA